MHVGTATIFQNPGKFTSDYRVYRDELRSRRPGRAAGLSIHLGRGAPLH